MKHIYSFLNDSLVREWIAPIFTAVVGAMITKFLFERKKEPAAIAEKDDVEKPEKLKSFTYQFKKMARNKYFRIVMVALVVFLAARFFFREPGSKFSDNASVVPESTIPTESESETEPEIKTWKDDNGTTFIGEQKNGKIVGYGEAQYANKESYEGEFKSGLCDGYGIKHFENGDWFEGDFIAGQIDGDGIYHWKNGDQYDGKWADGVRTGRGIFTGEDGTTEAQIWMEDVFVTNTIGDTKPWVDTDGTIYAGEQMDGKINGYGYVAYTNGGVYLGELKDGKKHGKGIFYFKSGDWYRGEWVDDNREGNGIYYFSSNGGWYQGEFLGGDRHGKGTYYAPDGFRYEGEWKDNVYFGEGICWYSPNDEQGCWFFEGEWDEDSQNGVMYYRDGTCKMGSFQNGELIQSTGQMNGIADQPDVITWEDEDGNKYTGQQENGVLVGEGICVRHGNQLYIGEVKDGKPDGMGTEYYNDGDYYVGEFVKGKRNGNGVYYYSDGGTIKNWFQGEWADGNRNGNCLGFFHENGSLNIGEFKEGFMSGKGTCYYKNGFYYGDWKKGKRTGIGFFQKNNGSCYVGGYLEGKMTGDGVMYYLNGSRYEGEWKDDKYHGVGVLYDEEGNEQYGRWIDGAYQK